MKNLTIFISLLLLTACNTNSNSIIKSTIENSRVYRLRLVDSLGFVTLFLHRRYDTSFSWIHLSDCGKPCEKIKYRFQPKALKVTKESGFIWTDEPTDSIERLTIVHSGYFPFHDNKEIDSLFISNYHDFRKHNTVLDAETYQIKSDTIERIGDRLFSILFIDLYDSTHVQYRKKVLAVTTIRGNAIEFKFELLTKQNDSLTSNFLNNSLNYLRTIQISNGR